MKSRKKNKEISEKQKVFESQEYKKFLEETSLDSSKMNSTSSKNQKRTRNIGKSKGNDDLNVSNAKVTPNEILEEIKIDNPTIDGNSSSVNNFQETKLDPILPSTRFTIDPRSEEIPKETISESIAIKNIIEIKPKRNLRKSKFTKNSKSNDQAELIQNIQSDSNKNSSTTKEEAKELGVISVTENLNPDENPKENDLSSNIKSNLNPDKKSKPKTLKNSNRQPRKKILKSNKNIVDDISQNDFINENTIQNSNAGLESAEVVQNTSSDKVFTNEPNFLRIRIPLPRRLYLKSRQFGKDLNESNLVRDNSSHLQYPDDKNNVKEEVYDSPVLPINSANKEQSNTIEEPKNSDIVDPNQEDLNSWKDEEVSSLDHNSVNIKNTHQSTPFNLNESKDTDKSKIELDIPIYNVVPNIQPTMNFNDQFPPQTDILEQNIKTHEDDVLSNNPCTNDFQSNILENSSKSLSNDIQPDDIIIQNSIPDAHVEASNFNSLNVLNDFSYIVQKASSSENKNPIPEAYKSDNEIIQSLEFDDIPEIVEFKNNNAESESLTPTLYSFVNENEQNDLTNTSVAAESDCHNDYSESVISSDGQTSLDDESTAFNLGDSDKFDFSYYSSSFFIADQSLSSSESLSLSYCFDESTDSTNNLLLDSSIDNKSIESFASDEDDSLDSLEFPSYESQEFVNWQRILPIMSFLFRKFEFPELNDAMKPLEEKLLKKEPLKPKKITESDANSDLRYLYFLKKVCYLGKNDAIYYCKDQAKFLLERGNKNKASLLPSKNYSSISTDDSLKINIYEENKKIKKQPIQSNQENNSIILQKLDKINDIKLPEYDKDTFEYLVFKHGENMESIAKESHMRIKDVILVYYLKYHNVELEISGSLLEKYVEEEWNMRDRILFEENFMKYDTKFHKYMINKSEDDLKIYYRFYLKNYIPINWTCEERTLFAHLFATYKKDWVAMEKCFTNKTAQDLKVYYCSYFKKLDDDERMRESKLVNMELPPIAMKKRGRKPNSIRYQEDDDKED